MKPVVGSNTEEFSEKVVEASWAMDGVATNKLFPVKLETTGRAGEDAVASVRIEVRVDIEAHSVTSTDLSLSASQLLVKSAALDTLGFYHETLSS